MKDDLLTTGVAAYPDGILERYLNAKGPVKTVFDKGDDLIAAYLALLIDEAGRTATPRDYLVGELELTLRELHQVRRAYATSVATQHHYYSSSALYDLYLETQVAEVFDEYHTFTETFFNNVALIKLAYEMEPLGDEHVIGLDKITPYTDDGTPLTSFRDDVQQRLELADTRTWSSEQRIEAISEEYEERKLALPVLSPDITEIDFTKTYHRLIKPDGSQAA
jgi:hypothetical protein